METKSGSGKECSPKNKNHWSNGLLKSLNDPNLKVFEDDLVTAIRDIYPKAAFHYLVCPKIDISAIKDVRPKHVPLLKHMAIIGEKISGKHEGKHFLMGYHAVPSMLRLHLHVISDDFNSKCMKTKRHWNSFTTDYFIPSDLFIKQLESGKFIPMSSVQAKELLNTKLKCHKCEYAPKNMPDLKNHILKHL